ncbi:MAG: hypothetical protein JXA49_09120, partial [Actinobacteria bacterium]|nr:hypothetical protein [Actinomycetota bacterium]
MFQNKTAVFTVLLVFLIGLLVLPGGAVAEPAPATSSAAAEDITGGNSFYDPDALSDNPEIREMQEESINEIPEQFAPRSFSEKSGDSTKRRYSERTGSGAGAGGWTTFTPANTPNPDPNINYDIDSSEWSNVIDTNGVQHTIIGVYTNTDISQFPDVAGFQYANLNKLYHLTYTNGAWSAPTAVTSISGFESTNLVLWELDEKGYLHMVYQKFDWGRDSSIGAGNTSAYMHTDDSLYYRYMAPDGTWSAPRAILSSAGAYWITDGSVELINNRVYAFILNNFNKETTPSTYTANYIFTDGALDSWNAPVSISHWDYENAAGNTIPFFTSVLGVSPLTGEVTAGYGTMYIGGGGPSTYKTNINAAVRDPGGTWSGVQSVAGGVNNQMWGGFLAVYNRRNINVNILGINSLMETSAAVPIKENFMMIYHDEDGWHTPVSITRQPNEYSIGGVDMSLDPWDTWHFIFSASRNTWDGANWQSTGEQLDYTTWSPGALADVEVNIPYAADRYFDLLDSKMDTSGKMHILCATANGAGTGYKAYYCDNAGGTWSAPTKLSTDTGQEITDVLVSTDPAGNTIATWAEKEISGGGDPVAGAIYSRSRTDNVWSTTRKVTQVPGSSDIMHVTTAFWPLYYDMVRENSLG